jgi:hypothetical protein
MWVAYCHSREVDFCHRLKEHIILDFVLSRTVQRPVAPNIRNAFIAARQKNVGKKNYAVQPKRIRK